jgi:8-oxo-dGTP pyrophosphatase MutT (NUDIX family)
MGNSIKRQIRPSVKALIIKDGKILVSKINDNGDIFYIMPGGGQEPEELLTETVKRECREELGIEIAPKEIVFIIEGRYGETFHRIDLVFLCEYIKKIENVEIIGDKNQMGNKWLDIKNLMNEPLYPSKLRKAIIDLYGKKATKVYLGDESMGETIINKNIHKT